MSNPIAYIRKRADGLLSKAFKMMDPTVRADYQSGARYLNLVADELDAEFHVSDEDE